MENIENEESINYSKYLPEKADAIDCNGIVMAYHVDAKHRKAIFNKYGELLLDDCSQILTHESCYFVDGIIYNKDFQPAVDLETPEYKRRRIVDLFTDGALLFNNESNMYELLDITNGSIYRELEIPSTNVPHRKSQILYDRFLLFTDKLYDIITGFLVDDKIFAVYKDYYMKIVGDKKLSLIDYSGNVLVDMADTMLVTDKHYGYTKDKLSVIHEVNGTEIFRMEKGFKIVKILNSSLFVLMLAKDEYLDRHDSATYYIIENGKPKLKYELGEYGGFVKNSEVFFRTNGKLHNIKDATSLVIPDGYSVEVGADTIYVYNNDKISLFDMNMDKIVSYKNDEFLENITLLNSRKEKLNDLLQWI